MWPHSMGLVVFRGALFLCVGNDLSFHTKQKPVLPWLLLFKVVRLRSRAAFQPAAPRIAAKDLRLHQPPVQKHAGDMLTRCLLLLVFVSAQDKGSNL